VLGGGVSSERDISLVSAKQAFETLKYHNLDVVFVDIKSRKPEDIRYELLSRGIDLVFIALHGEFGEDGGIQTILEELGIPYTGSGPRASYLAMDKIATKKIFQREHIPTAHFQIAQKGEPYKAPVQYPVVVKPYYAGSSLGVSIVKAPEQFESAMSAAFSLQDKVLIEEYIAGREFTVGILEEQAMGVVEIVPRHGYFDFHTKYSDGNVEFIAPAQLPGMLSEQIQGIALHAHRALGCRHFSRVDFRVDRENQPFVLEVNSIPGLTSHSLLPLSAHCCGITFDGLILKMLLLAYHEKKHTQKV
jgi:D-alanine-D-alanine ligase